MKNQELRPMAKVRQNQELAEMQDKTAASRRTTDQILQGYSPTTQNAEI
ncbi:TPA: hypothetical protein NPY76_004687 [Escherichia coli]|nr:hypothetical protein [Escherichia coli]